MSVCKGLHCGGCNSGGSGAGVIAVIIVIMALIGSGAAARAADSIMHAIEMFMIIAGITLGSTAVLGLGGWLGGRALLRARARARAPLSAPQTLHAVAVLRPVAELPPARLGQAESPLDVLRRAQGSEVPAARLGR